MYSHWIGGPWDHHFAFVSSNVIKQMKDKEMRQVKHACLSVSNFYYV